MKQFANYGVGMILMLILGLGVPLALYGESDMQRDAMMFLGGKSKKVFEEYEIDPSAKNMLNAHGLLEKSVPPAHRDFSEEECGKDLPIRLAALDSPNGPPPCGLDNVCNFSVCSNDPDCPAGLPQQESESEPYEQPHNEKGIGGSVWLTTGPDGYEGGHSCDFDKGTCNIKVTWSVQPDKYDKWKICWKDWGDTFTDACDVNQKIRKFENYFYVIPDLKENHHYRIRLEGRKDKNDKWKCLIKARLRNVHLNGANIGDAVPCIVP